MKTKLMRALSLVLCICILATLFSGCNENKQEAIQATADSVDYKESGSYTTTVTVEKTKLTEVTADDVSVVYSVFDYEGYSAAIQAAKEDEIPNEDDYTTEKAATVSEVTPNGEDSLTVSFTDAEAAANVTDSYSIKIDSKNVAAYVGVIFAEHTLTPDIDYVLASSNETKLTFTLEDGEFSPDISVDNIMLYGSFSDLSIESLSSAGKNLTMQLTGIVAKDESAGAYLNGFVSVDKTGIIDAGKATTASIPVQTQTVRFASESMTANGNTVVVPLTLIDVEDVAALTKDSFSFENGVNVTDCKQDSDTQVTLTMTVTGASDKNSAAKLLDGQTVKINGEHEFIAGFASAGFYPVFDYVEEDGENLKFTLNLYANGGSFANTLKNDAFSFGGGFEGATVVSVEITSDTVAQLAISVPSNGQSVEKLNMNGNVILAVGALINSWGDASAEEVSYLRNYSQDSMGKDLDDIDINKIKDIVGGFGNTAFGTFSSLVSGGVDAAKGIQTLLEMLGIIESSEAATQRKLDEIIGTLDQIQNTLFEHGQLLKNIQNRQLKDSLSALDTKLKNMSKYAENVNKLFKNAKKKSGMATSESGNGDEANALISYLSEAVNNPNHPDRAAFLTFSNDYNILRNNFIDICNSVCGNMTNPIQDYDDLRASIDNFDTTGYDAREWFRLDIEGKLTYALATILLYDQSDIIMDLYNSTIERMEGDEYKVKRRTDGRTYVYVLGATTPQAKGWDKGSYYRKNDAAIRNCLDSNGKAIKATNFTSDQIKEFINRMQKRTMEQELAAAGITYNTDIAAGIKELYPKYTSWINPKLQGMAFICTKDKAFPDGYFFAPINSDKEMPTQPYRMSKKGYLVDYAAVYMPFGSDATTERHTVFEADAVHQSRVEQALKEAKTSWGKKMDFSTITSNTGRFADVYVMVW